MIKSSFILIILIFLLTVSNSCRKAPKYSEIPVIQFDKLEIIGDSIMNLTIKFQDGDGDLGLDDSDLQNPLYKEYEYVLDSAGKKIPFDETQVGKPPFFLPPLSCKDYIGDGKGKDTLVKYNPHYYNYFIDIAVKQSGSYVPFVFPDICFTLNGAFPPLRPKSYEGPLEGTLLRTFDNSVVDFVKSADVRFTVYIEDRQLHRSLPLIIFESF